MRWQLGFGSAGVTAVLIMVLVSSVGAVAGAGDPAGSPRGLLGPDFRISGNAATSGEEYPAVAYNSTSNRYLVVWGDGRNYLSRGADVFGQRVAANGNRVGGNRRISGPAATADEGYAVVAYNPANNQYLVVWRDRRKDATRGTEIYGQRVAADGSRVGPDFRISGPAATADEFAPAVAYNSTSNQYLVVWGDDRNYATGDWDIYGQRVAANGDLVGTNRRLSGKSASSQEKNPAVAYNSTRNQYLVVWEDFRNQATREWDIYGQRVAANGNRIRPDFRISGNAATSDEGYAAVVYNPANNQYVVVWDDFRNQATRGWDIYGQRVAANGNLVGTNRRISGKNTTSHEVIPAVAYNPTGNQYLVVWEDFRNQATRERDIYGQRVAANGNRAGTGFRISGKNATSIETNPAVVHNAGPTTSTWSSGRMDARQIGDSTSSGGGSAGRPEDKTPAWGAVH